MAGLLDKDILRLQIAVGDAEAMEVLESADDLGQIESNDGWGEDAISLAVTEDVEVAAGTVRDGPSEELIGVECA